MKIIIILFITTLSLTLSGCTNPPVVNQNVSTSVQTEIPKGNIYFYSSTCPHCQTVRDYITSNNTQQKLFFLELEISKDAHNADILRAVGSRCLINENNLSVPLFWNGNQCYVGSDNVINYFQTLK